jgi:hypothetical protein
MWWCCGKTSKEAKGCKFQKHVLKDDEEDLKEDENKKDQNRRLRCNCCHEYGHVVTQCPRDPNFKTVTPYNVAAEELRLLALQDYRKLYADTVVQTTHMLKRSVMIPLKTDEEGKVSEDVKNVNNPFMRGVMEFDDYNYD